MTAFTLDESVIERSAVHYTSNLPWSLLHDVNARATDRLYSLILSIAFRLFSGADAVRFDHVLSVALFVSAAIPIYIFATNMLRSRWAATGAALLSVAVPWLGLTSALFTENLSYPLFWWMMLATSRAIWRPSPARDLIALVSIGLLIVTRIQFVAVFVGYVLAMLTILAWRTAASGGWTRRAANTMMTYCRRCPSSASIIVAAIAVFVYERASGGWAQHVEALLGSYSNVVIHKTIPPNLIEAASVEVIALALGVGLLPALVSVPWYVKSIAKPDPADRQWVLLLSTGVLLVTFVLLTAFSQLGYLGAMTEERYFFYVAPVFWLGAFAALQARNVRPGEIILCAVAFAGLYGAIPFVTPPLSQETAFLAPIESIVPHVFAQREAEIGLTGLTEQDALAALAIAAALLTALVWRRPRLRPLWVVGAAACLQLVIVGYAYAVLNGDVQGIPGRTSGSVAERGWLDASARTSNVWWLDNVSTAAPPADPAGPGDNQARGTLFWNTDITHWAMLPSVGLPPVEWPMTSLPSSQGLSVRRSTGLLQPTALAGDMREAVGAADSPFIQLSGKRLARSPDGILELSRLSQPVRARWLALGLQPDGSIAAGAPVRLLAFAAGNLRPLPEQVALTITPPPLQAGETVRRTSLRLSLGRTTRNIALATGGPPRRITIAACFSAGQRAVSGDLQVTQAAETSAGNVAGTLSGVELRAAGAAVESRCRGG